MNGVYYTLINGMDVALTDFLGVEECLQIQPQLKRLDRYDKAVIEIEKRLEKVKQCNSETDFWKKICFEEVLKLLKGNNNESSC